MPFEPKLIGKPEDETSEASPPATASTSRPAEPVWDDADALNLPDDLAALAEQLHCDADHLARCHGADATPAERAAAWKANQPAAAPGRRRKLWWAAAVLLAAIPAGAMALAVWHGPDEPVPPRRSSIASSQSDHHQARQHQAAGAAEDLSRKSLKEINQHANSAAPSPKDNVAESAAENAPRLQPAAFLRDVTGPELDGVLDLMEQETSGLSI